MPTASEARAEPAPPAVSRAFYVKFSDLDLSHGLFANGDRWFTLDDAGELIPGPVNFDRIWYEFDGETVEMSDGALFVLAEAAKKRLAACPLFGFLAQEEAENVWGPSPDPWAGERLNAAQYGVTTGRL